MRLFFIPVLLRSTFAARLSDLGSVSVQPAWQLPRQVEGARHPREIAFVEAACCVSEPTSVKLR
jgi:hypothetical protein